METPVTNLEQRGCLEQMAKMFNTKLEEVASMSQAVSPRQNPLKIQKIELQVNDIKLEGTKEECCYSRLKGSRSMGGRVARSQLTSKAMNGGFGAPGTQ